MGYAHVSKRAQQLDLDFQRLVLPSWPVRSFDGLVTAVYQYQIRDGWTAQPNFQYIIHPAAAPPFLSARRSGTHLKNAQFSA